MDEINIISAGKLAPLTTLTTSLNFPSSNTSESKLLDDTSILSSHPQDKTIIEEVKVKRSKDSELNGSRITRQQLLNTRINVKKVTFYRNLR